MNDMTNKEKGRRTASPRASKGRTPGRRSQGRPTENAVGRDAVLAAARRQLQELPPARVTISSIAREAGIDPALVRYYFGDREKLLIAVVDQMTAELPSAESTAADPLDDLVHKIRVHPSFMRSAKNMHRLMIDELAGAASPEVRERQAEINRVAVAGYEAILTRDGGRQLNPVDPMFLFIAMVGIFDFFVSGQALIRNLVPKDADMDELERDFVAFVENLVLNGIRKR